MTTDNMLQLKHYLLWCLLC